MPLIKRFNVPSYVQFEHSLILIQAFFVCLCQTSGSVVCQCNYSHSTGFGFYVALLPINTLVHCQVIVCNCCRNHQRAFVLTIRQFISFVLRSFAYDWSSKFGKLFKFFGRVAWALPYYARK